ncbi:MAG: ATP-binding protein [Deltaproteobacteria bacterium]|nr:ATP-binding protein [Deltaproteobacteria bacterium]
MRIAFASGKGGTGKTLLATRTAWRLALRRARHVTYVDADVEAPNGEILLDPSLAQRQRVTRPVPALVEGRCDLCRVCVEACAWNALLPVSAHSLMVFEELCHGCGACLLACPRHALVERPRGTGTLRFGGVGSVRFVSGELDVGEARPIPVIQAALEAAPREGLTLVDCPPGTSCPAMAAVRGADCVVLVTEPTPFGLHDLELAVEMCRALERPVVAVINRSDLGDDSVERYLAREEIRVVGRIPFDPAIARAVAAGDLAALASEPLDATVDAVLGIAGEA